MHARAATLVAVAAALVGAAPASAVTGGFGVATAVRTGPAPVLLTVTAGQGKGKLASCHATALRTRTGKPTVGERVGRKAAPVACEQPPRSGLSSDALKHATAAAMSVIG